MWVKSRYTSELAVLAAWVSVLVPWNVVYHTGAAIEEFPTLSGETIEGTIFFLRFPFFELQIREQNVAVGEILIENFDEELALQYAGAEVFGGLYVTTPPTSATFYEGAIWQASLLWSLAALALALAVALSLALYFRTDRTIERLPVSEVRLMGGLLGVAALGMAGSTYLYFLERETMGTPIPVGVLVVGALSLVLLRTKEVPATTSEPEAT